MQVRIADIKIPKRYRKKAGDVKSIAESISKYGLLQAIGIMPDKTLIFGMRRLQACKTILKWEYIEATILDLDDPLGAQIEENTQRKDFTVSERAAIAHVIEQREKPGAKDRELAGTELEPSVKFTEGDKSDREAKNIAAKAVGMSRPTLAKAEEVIEAAKKDPKKYGKIAAAMDETGNVSAAYRELKAIQKREEVEKMAENAQYSDILKVYLHDKTDIIKDGIVDLVCTDLPYNISRDRTIDFPDRKSMDRNKGSWDQMSYEEYICFLEDRAFDFYRMLREGGSVYAFIGEAFASRFREALIQAGFNFKGFVYWVMTNPCPKPDKTSWIQGVDHIAFAIKGAGNTFNWTKTNEMYNYIEMPICQGNERYNDHPTQKPLKLIERLIEVSSLPGDLVVDPYAGTGTVGEACQKLRRRFILIEKEPDYVKIIEQRTGIKANVVKVQDV